MEPSRNANRSRGAQRRRAAKRRKVMLQLLCAGLIMVLAVLLSFLLLFDPISPVAEHRSPVVSSLTVEAGSALEPQMLLTNAQRDGAKPITITPELSGLNTGVTGSHSLSVTLDGETYSVTVRVVDRTPPAGEPVRSTTAVGVLPKPETLVTNIQDMSQVTISYATEPDVSRGGMVTAKVLLTDASGNTATVEVLLTVVADETPPVIEGAADFQVFVGDSIAYKAGITVTDNQTKNPKLVVDNSQVDTGKAGTYPVTYTATDDAGNATSVTITLTLVDKPAGYVEPEVVYEQAQKILNEITTEDMTDMQVAFAIYRWANTNIKYRDTSDKSSWTKAANQGFTERTGDCYVFFAAAKALFDVAGIDNVDVVKSDTSHSAHYWSLINLGDGWYHVDCTPRRKVGYFFMNTDAELEAYSVNNKNSHIFDGSLYPERATESVQDLVDYKNGKVTG